MFCGYGRYKKSVHPEEGHLPGNESIVHRTVFRRALGGLNGGRFPNFKVYGFFIRVGIAYLEEEAFGARGACGLVMFLLHESVPKSVLCVKIQSPACTGMCNFAHKTEFGTALCGTRKQVRKSHMRGAIVILHTKRNLARTCVAN